MTTRKKAAAPEVVGEPAGRKVKGGATIVRQGDPGPVSSKGKGKLEFTPDPNAPTPEQIAAVERAGGRVAKPAAE